MSRWVMRKKSKKQKSNLIETQQGGDNNHASQKTLRLCWFVDPAIDVKPFFVLQQKRSLKKTVYYSTTCWTLNQASILIFCQKKTQNPVSSVITTVDAIWCHPPGIVLKSSSFATQQSWRLVWPSLNQVVCCERHLWKSLFELVGCSDHITSNLGDLDFTITYHEKELKKTVRII